MIPDGWKNTELSELNQNSPKSDDSQWAFVQTCLLVPLWAGCSGTTTWRWYQGLTFTFYAPALCVFMWNAEQVKAGCWTCTERAGLNRLHILPRRGFSQGCVLCSTCNCRHTSTLNRIYLFCFFPRLHVKFVVWGLLWDSTSRLRLETSIHWTGQ